MKFEANNQNLNAPYFLEISMSLIIFDLDNTLVHSQINFAGMRAAIGNLLREQNVTQENNEELRRFSVGEMITRAAEKDAAIAETAWNLVLDFEREGMAKATVEADAAATLKVLSERKFKLAILTNNARAATIDALKKFDLLHYFDLVLSRDEVPMKPDAGGILYAKSTFKAERVFHVGDAWLDGVAANRADVPFIAFRPLPEAFKGRDITVWNSIQQLSELPELL
jgi:phosphoglycolate phosphatase